MVRTRGFARKNPTPSAPPTRKRIRVPNDSEENSISEENGLISVPVQQDRGSHTSDESPNRHANTISGDGETNSNSSSSGDGSTGKSITETESESERDSGPSKKAKQQERVRKPTQAATSSSRVPVTRTRLGRGKSALPPTLTEYITLSGDLLTRYEANKRRHITQDKIMDPETVIYLNLDIDEFIDGTMWKSFFDINCPTTMNLFMNFTLLSYMTRTSSKLVMTKRLYALA